VHLPRTLRSGIVVHQRISRAPKIRGSSKCAVANASASQLTTCGLPARVAVRPRAGV